MKVTVDGTDLDVANGTTILEAAKLAEAWVPTFCYDERQKPFGACRVCLVAVGGAPKPLPACTTPCRDGMEIEAVNAAIDPPGGARTEFDILVTVSRMLGHEMVGRRRGTRPTRSRG